MDIIRGIQYNFKGLFFSLKTGKLLLLGLVRFVVLILILMILAGLVLSFHRDLMTLLWEKPESLWLIWLWHLLSCKFSPPYRGLSRLKTVEE